MASMPHDFFVAIDIQTRKNIGTEHHAQTPSSH